MDIITNIKKITIEKVLFWFILLQPIFDIYMSIVGEKLDLFSFSIVTMTRIAIVVFLFLFVFLKSIKEKKNKKINTLCIGYLLLVIAYVVTHHFNIQINGDYYINNNLYKASTEALYVLRLILPFILIYSIYLIKPKIKSILKAIIIASSIVSLVIVITNILQISFSSYFTEKIFIEGSIFSWITLNPEQIDYKLYTSKGFFVSANQIAALLSITYSILLYNTIKTRKISMCVALLIQTVAMVMLGTRTGMIGWQISMLVIILVFVFKSLIYKKLVITPKTIVVIISILVLGFILGNISPANNRKFAVNYQDQFEEFFRLKELEDERYIPVDKVKFYLEDDEALLSYLNISNEENIDLAQIKEDFLIDYIFENYTFHYISEIYIEKIYPYKDDPIFWIDVLNEPLYIKGDNRQMQLLIANRLYENSENKVLNRLLGMGATPMNLREYMIEKDIVAQYYNLGIIGVLLFVLPYLYGIIYVVIIYGIKNKKQIFKSFKAEDTNIYDIFVYIFSIILGYSISYFWDMF